MDLFKDSKIVRICHDLIQEKVELGDHVIDATLGRGKDTIFLAGLVGPKGQVTAYDIQDEAIDSSGKAIAQAGVLDRVKLHHQCHSEIASLMAFNISAVVFNLGYLPDGDSSVVTRSETSVPAINASLDRLKPGGRLVVVYYTEHDGAFEEYKEVLRNCENLKPDLYRCFEVRQANRSSSPGVLIVDRIAAGNEQGEIASR